CATNFGNAQALSERASTAAGRLAPLLVEKQDAAKKAQLELRNATASLQQNETIRARSRDLTSQIEIDVVHNRDLLDHLGWEEPHTPEALSNGLEELERAIAEASQRRARRQRWIGRLAPDLDGLARERGIYLRQRDDARRNDNAASRRLGDLLGE